VHRNAPQPATDPRARSATDGGPGDPRTAHPLSRTLTRRRTRALGAMLMPALLAACGSDEPAAPMPTPVTISVEASPFLNPDRNRRPSPIVVIFYGLTEDAAFKNAGFFELYEKEQETLGDAVKSKQEFIIAPGDIEDLNMELDPAATFVGALAAFRDIDNSVFKAVIPVTPGEPFSLQAKLQSNEILLVAPEPPVEEAPEEEG